MQRCNSWASVAGLFLAFAANVPHGQGGVWVNDFQQPLNFTCPDLKFIGAIFSYHDDSHEDRRFYLHCNELPIAYGMPLQPPSCGWTGFQNVFDGDLVFRCPNESYVAGLYSIYDSSTKDRRYDFYCCEVPETRVPDCNFTGNMGWYDEPSAYIVPDDRVLKGVRSIHNSHKQDRLFNYEVCRMSCH